MKEKSIISSLRLKFAERSWNDTFQLVRRCMEKSRDKSRPCGPLVRSLERLQEEFNVSSLNITKSRLELIAKQQGMGFHVTDTTCYLTADLFYLEVVLDQYGRVEEVKVAPQVGPPVSSESLLQLLRLKNYTDFSRKLAGLFAQYNMPGDNDVKLKLFTSLQHLGKDLQQISLLQRAPEDTDSKIDLINNGMIGCVIEGREDCPLAIQFYVTPTESASRTADSKPVIYEAQVTVGSSTEAHKLQMTSLIPQPPQLDPHGAPVFLLLNEVPHETQPACFLLKLQPFIPVTAYFMKKLSLITNVPVPDVDLQWAPLPSLLVRDSQSANCQGETLDEQDTIYTVKIPDGVMHSCILPRAAWEASAQIATLMEGVPFTHPAHVPALLELLRHQCVINTLLTSCVIGATSGPVCDLHFEVLPEMDTSFSVTFNPPDTDTLAVLLVNISDAHQITCSLFGAGTGDASLDQYISTVMMRCMSVPVTLTTLQSKLKELASTPHSPSRMATEEAENDHTAPSSAAVTDTESTMTKLSQGAAVVEDSSGVSGSAYYDMSVADSELLLSIEKSPTVSP